MTKETKNTVSAETIVENLKEFANKLHDDSKDGMLHFLLKGDIRKFKLANVFHNISHDLLEDEQDEKDIPVVGSIAVNLKTGDAHGIEDITDPKLKEQILAAVSKVVEELGGN